MNETLTYKLVYLVVNRTLESNKPIQKGCEKMFEWAKRIPSPKKCSKNMAIALCRSVSQSREIGLECFFQEPLYLSDIRKVNGFKIKEEIEFKKFEKINISGDSYLELGNFIRQFFNHGGFLNNDDYIELKKI